MRIYVACLASYNSGNLYGRWIDVEGKSSDDIQAEIDAMLRASPSPDAEEWSIHDYDGPKGFASLGENPDLEDLVEFVNMYEEHGDAWIAYVDAVGEHYATPSGFEGAYQGDHDSLFDYAYQFVEDTGMLQGIPEHVARYFDYEAFARDMELSGDISAISIEGKIYIFNNH